MCYTFAMSLANEDYDPVLAKNQNHEKKLIN